MFYQAPLNLPTIAALVSPSISTNKSLATSINISDHKINTQKINTYSNSNLISKSLINRLKQEGRFSQIGTDKDKDKNKDTYKYKDKEINKLVINSPDKTTEKLSPKEQEEQKREKKTDNNQQNQPSVIENKGEILNYKSSNNSSNNSSNIRSNNSYNVVPDTSGITANEFASSGVGNNNLLLGITINKKDVGNLDVIREGNTLFLPLVEFSKLANFRVETVEKTTDNINLITPLGKIKLTKDEFKEIDGVTYISDRIIPEKFLGKIELNSFDFALNIDLPWGEGRETRPEAVELQPEFFAPRSGLSSFRQELNFTSTNGDTNLQSSSLLGGRLDGGLWRVRVNNNFINSPDISEYFYYKTNGQFSYQAGQQQLGLHPLLNSISFTGAQFGFTNLPEENFNQNTSASEILPRRSRPIQTFQGIVPPASFVQLRVGGIAIAQQQVGLNGKYEFLDINLPTGQNNEIELLVFDRNNPNVPIEIRSLRLNSSDLLLPTGGNVQLGGVGLTGNLAQNTLFNENSTEAGKFTSFYQLRQGLSENLTFEGGIQTLPNTLQTQAGFIWRPANPLILSTSVGTSNSEVGYIADLDFQFNDLQIIGNSQLFPNGYVSRGIGNSSTTRSPERYNHSLEVKYKAADALHLGFIARSRLDSTKSSDYILPTFTFRPMSGMYLNGRPDTEGNYLFNALYQVDQANRLSFNTFGNRYFSDYSYSFDRQYQLSLGSEFGGDFATRYSMSVNRNAFKTSGLSWRLGLAYSDRDIAPIVGASMQVLPGLLARVDYQGIPSASRNNLGGFGSDRLSISLVSDLSFAGGKISPGVSTSLGKQKGAIAGRILIDTQKKASDSKDLNSKDSNSNLNLSGSIVRVINNRGKNVGSAVTDASGNFFVGNLAEGVYTVELDPEKLPIELTLAKTIAVAQVASSAVTNLDFTARAEYGLAGRVIDATGKPAANIRLDLMNSQGKKILAASTDEFGLYRLDGVPAGSYILSVPAQTSSGNQDSLAKIPVEIRNKFVYDQNLQLSVSTASQ
jgi:hypothetical protein